MQKPPLELPPIYITPDDPHAMELFGDRQGSSFNGIYGPAGANQSTREKMYDTQIALEEEFGAKSVRVSQSIEVELAATRLEGPTNPLPPTAALLRELGVRSTLIQRKSAELHRQTAVANSFFGSDPIGKKFGDFLDRASAIRQANPRGPGARDLWNQSYRAAHEAKLLAQMLQMLYEQSAGIQHALSVLQAQEARAAAEHEAQRIEAEAARVRMQLHQAAEMARLKDEEDQRAAARFAQLQAEKKEEAERQWLLIIAERKTREAQEQARIAEVTAALAKAEEDAAAEFQRFANEQSRLNDEMELRIEHIQKRLQTKANILELRRKAVHTATSVAQRQIELANQLFHQGTEQESRYKTHSIANSGSLAALGPVFAGISGTINVGPATTLELTSALRTAIATLTGMVGAATAPVIVGFAALLAPSRLGNSDLYSISVPLAELADVSNSTLNKLAAVGGAIALPVRLGSTTLDSRVEFVIAATDGVAISANVPVRFAQYDGAKNIFTIAGAVPKGPIITWTPAVQPQNPSTDLPAAQMNPPVYPGASVIPNEGRIDTAPLPDGYDFGGFITVFPADSGIPPLFVAFNSPYEGATALGEHSGRNFNPEQAGGPILDLDWRTAVITKAGTEGVKLHISRFDQSDANDVMVRRLEKILSGQEVVTDTDLRYYTHEIRELERFRALGLSDSFKPETGSPIWNNTHTATLEDYKLSSDDTLLYSPDALAAGDEQLDIIYGQILKGAD